MEESTNESISEIGAQNNDTMILQSSANHTNCDNCNNKKNREKKPPSRFVQYFKAIFNWKVVRLMISHHPYCDHYDSHVFKIGPVRFCKGCFLSYPPLYTIVLLFIFWEKAREFFLTPSFHIDNLWWFVIGSFILALLYFLGKFSMFIKDLSKFGRGLFAGFLFCVILSQHWAFKIPAALIIIAGMTILSVKRGREMERDCRECEWQAQFDVCPGWRESMERLSLLNQSYISDTKTTAIKISNNSEKPESNEKKCD
ncbi:MAG: hypothetical protein FK734_05150 [Asgard group archaeon]|nr:hypothetical protein [Asgard group archaeon]